jgi:uncharacterized protein (DUF1800 family)
MSLEGAIAVHRFGLGARPGEIAEASTDPKGWLKAQIAAAQQPVPPPGVVFKDGGALVAEQREQLRQRFLIRRQVAQNNTAPPALAADPQMAAAPAANAARVRPGQQAGLPRPPFQDEMAARFNLGFTSQRPFAEHLVWFWSNHFTVSVTANQTRYFAGAFEREAIRPYIADKFENMLLAVASHPAMLTYLNNNASIGPDSPLGQRSKRGLNENLGRELMELYSLGVDGGYTQADVIALANILTGWALDPDAPSGFNFFVNRHQPGAVTLRGKRYEPTLAGGIQAVRDLGRDPHTAHHIATKMATYFISDTPSAQSIGRLEQCFNQTGGDLKALSAVLVDDPAAWEPRNPQNGAGKMRTPVEYVTAGYRLLGLPQGPNAPQQTQAAMGTARNMGEFPMSATSPKGWPLTSEAWSGPDAVLNRIEWAKQVGARMAQNFDALAAAKAGLGPLLTSATLTAMKRAETQGDALALMLSSPEFQRR